MLLLAAGFENKSLINLRSRILDKKASKLSILMKFLSIALISTTKAKQIFVVPYRMCVNQLCNVF